MKDFVSVKLTRRGEKKPITVKVPPLYHDDGCIKSYRDDPDDYRASAVVQLATSGQPLTGINARGIDGCGIYIGGRDISGADFTDALLTGAEFTNVRAEGARFADAYLSGASFSAADLRNANFSDATLRGVSFYAADLRGANLRGAHLCGANFAECRVTGARVRGAQLSRLVARAKRSRGGEYEFFLWETMKGRPWITAGCRSMSPKAFRRHVDDEYRGTDKAAETLRILDYFDAAFAAHIRD